MRNKAIMGLLLASLSAIAVSAQTTYVSTSVSVNAGSQAVTFTFAGPNGSQMLLYLPCGNGGTQQAQLITHADQYGAQQDAGFEVGCSSRSAAPGYPTTYSQYLTQPLFNGEITLNGEPVSNTPNTVNLQINSANWSWTCYRYRGCPASGSASITITGSF